MSKFPTPTRNDQNVTNGTQSMLLCKQMVSKMLITVYSLQCNTYKHALSILDNYIGLLASHDNAKAITYAITLDIRHFNYTPHP